MDTLKELVQKTFRQTIIIVEDDPDNTEMLMLLLEQEGSYQTVCFQDGDDVFAKLKMIKMLKPVLFLLDYQLPTMTALDLYERLHATDGLEKVPAFIVSGFPLEEEQKQRVRQLGLTLIQKPYNIDEFLTSIKKRVAH